MVIFFKNKPCSCILEFFKDLEEQDLEDSFQERFRKDARRRLEKDEDYKAGRFPNSDKYYFAEN